MLMGHCKAYLVDWRRNLLILACNSPRGLGGQAYGKGADYLQEPNEP